MPKKGKGRGRGRGRGRDQKKPGESISPGKGEEEIGQVGQRSDDGGHHDELQVAAATVASTAVKSLEATAKEDQGVYDTQSQLEQMVISDKNVVAPPPESTSSVSIDKSPTAKDLKQATIDQPAAAQASSQQTHNQAVNNQSVSLGSTTSATRSINGSGKWRDYRMQVQSYTRLLTMLCVQKIFCMPDCRVWQVHT